MYLRLGESAISGYSSSIAYGTPIFVLISALSFRAWGMYQGIWR